MGEGIRIGGGGGVRGVLKTYPTDFGVSKGDLCEIVPAKNYERAPQSDVTDSSSNTNLVAVRLDGDRMFYATSAGDSYNMYIAIQTFGEARGTAKKTNKVAFPIAAYLVSPGIVHLYTVNNTSKIVIVYSVDVSGTTPVLGSEILRFSTSNSTYPYFKARPGFSEICSLGNNRYILFTAMNDYTSYGFWNDVVQVTPIYDDGTTIIKGTPLLQNCGHQVFYDCCDCSDNTISKCMAVFIENSSSASNLPVFVEYVFSDDTAPILTAIELTLNDTTKIAAKIGYANNIRLLKLLDGTYGLFILDETFYCRVAHYRIENNVVSIIGTITQITTDTAGTANAIEQTIVAVTSSASKTSSLTTGTLSIDTVDMSSEPTVVKSESLSKNGNASLGAPYVALNTVSTIFRSERARDSKYIFAMKLKMLDTVEKSSKVAYSNKNTLANGYGEFKVQE